ncbi:hypothetical protein RDV64_16295 [Acuticoccus sp. MNP-M23]|uniref:hypothetical protein n=1 Tax=Acuticoccus sp. MNP-M23 TaxID=3072793 RepID=UPI00281545EA|nr:hypothetical protein [Acuticoccus sp. MNP-M23]WMS41628.1 hypothetical protein RDV64_16295 [Acuticoccus sp. MNP-M23]
MNNQYLLSISKGADAVTNIVALKKYGQDESVKIKESSRAVCASYNLLKVVNYLDSNIDDFHRAAIALAENQISQNNLVSTQVFDMATDFERILLNISASFYTLINQQSKAISADFGRESIEHKRWLEFKDKLRENFECYDTLWQIRSYIEHESMPDIKHSVQIKIGSQVDISVDVEKILSNNHLSGRKKRRHSRSSSGSYISAIAIFNEALEISNLIAGFIAVTRSNTFETQANTLIDLRKEFSLEPSDSVALVDESELPSPAAGKLNLNLFNLPLPWAQRLVELTAAGRANDWIGGANS